MTKLIWVIGYVLKPILFKHFGVVIQGNEVYSNGELYCISPTPEKSAIASCMANYKIVQFLLAR